MSEAPGSAAKSAGQSWLARAVGVLHGGTETIVPVVIAAVTLAIYLYASPSEQVFDYHVRLADALLKGRLGLIEAPSWLNELIPKDGLWYVPYPPMPAFVLVPAVAIFGPGLPQQVASSVAGAISVGLTWLVLGRFALSMGTRVLLTMVFAFGTVLWYTASVGSAWYYAHAVAVAFMTGSILLALRRQWPWLAGLLLGCATISRLPVGLTAPFVLAMLVGIGWPPRPPSDRREAFQTTVAFVAGLAVPLAVYAAYNYFRYGTPIDQGYVLIPGVLEDPIYRDGILSVLYIPRHVYAIFFRSWNYVDSPPFFQPSWWGLGLFLTTPLLLWIARARLRDPRVVYAALGFGLASIPIVTHGNVGISQFGYRFSLDVQPLLFVVLATVFERGVSRLAAAAGIASVAVCAYAYWAIVTGFVSY